jgi:thiamine pyrophosphokinase
LAKILELPQFRAEFSKGKGSFPLVLVAGGRQPEPGWFADLCRDRRVWAVDSGIDLCRKCGVSPDLFIGDRDSATAEGILWAKNNKIESMTFPPEKNLTDLQIALRETGLRAGGTPAILTAAFGGRFDHLFSNIFSLIWGEEEWGSITRCIADDKESLLLLRGPEKVDVYGLETGTLVSLLALSDKCTGVCLEGTRWPLENASILRNRPYAVSNYSVADSFRLKISEGWIGVYVRKP